MMFKLRSVLLFAGILVLINYNENNELSLLLNFAPPFGPTVGWGSNFPQGTTTVVGGKNSTARVASYPALTFFLKKVFFK